MTRDEREYLSLARSLAAGDGFVYDAAVATGPVEPFGRAPGYPVFLALVGGGRAVTESVPASVKVAQSVVGGARRAARRAARAAPRRAARGDRRRRDRRGVSAARLDRQLRVQRGRLLAARAVGRLAHRPRGLRRTSRDGPPRSFSLACSPASPSSSARRCCSFCRSPRPGSCGRASRSSRAVFLLGAEPA